MLDWTPRSKLTASLLEPLKKARSSGSSSPRSRGFGSYSPSGAQSDGFAQMDEDEQLVARCQPAIRLEQCGGRAVGRKTTLANSYKPNMGQMSPVSEHIYSLCNLMRHAGDSHGSRETWITGFPIKLAALIPQ